MATSRSASVLRFVGFRIGIVVLGIVLAPLQAAADPGNFWYGPYRAFRSGMWGDSVFTKLRDEFKMNWILGEINDQSTMNLVAASGLKVLQWPYVPDTTVTVARYSGSSWLRLQAEGDFVAYQWDPSSSSATTIKHTGGNLILDCPVSDKTGFKS